jgi:hypothetical protein
VGVCPPKCGYTPYAGGYPDDGEYPHNKGLAGDLRCWLAVEPKRRISNYFQPTTMYIYIYIYIYMNIYIYIYIYTQLSLETTYTDFQHYEKTHNKLNTFKT